MASGYATIGEIKASTGYSAFQLASRRAIKSPNFSPLMVAEKISHRVMQRLTKQRLQNIDKRRFEQHRDEARSRDTILQSNRLRKRAYRPIIPSKTRTMSFNRQASRLLKPNEGYQTSIASTRNEKGIENRSGRGERLQSPRQFGDSIEGSLSKPREMSFLTSTHHQNEPGTVNTHVQRLSETTNDSMNDLVEQFYESLDRRVYSRREPASIKASLVPITSRRGKSIGMQPFQSRIPPLSTQSELPPVASRTMSPLSHVESVHISRERSYLPRLQSHLNPFSKARSIISEPAEAASRRLEVAKSRKQPIEECQLEKALAEIDDQLQVQFQRLGSTLIKSTQPRESGRKNEPNNSAEGRDVLEHGSNASNNEIKPEVSERKQEVLPQSQRPHRHRIIIPRRRCLLPILANRNRRLHGF